MKYFELKFKKSIDKSEVIPNQDPETLKSDNCMRSKSKPKIKKWTTDI